MSHNVGQAGEDLAVDFLRKKKYKILTVNYRSRFGEIDIVAQKGKIICFVEVKNRSSDKFGVGAEAVNLSKQKKIISLAQQFLFQNKYADCDFRFDVIDISAGCIEHFENAFQAE